MSQRAHEIPFRAFYRVYLQEHHQRGTKVLHFVGTSLVIPVVAAAAVAHLWWLIPVAIVQGCALAWVGHCFVEHKLISKPSFWRLRKTLPIPFGSNGLESSNSGPTRFAHQGKEFIS